MASTRQVEKFVLLCLTVGTNLQKTFVYVSQLLDNWFERYDILSDVTFGMLKKLDKKEWC